MRALLLLLILCCCDGGSVAAVNEFWKDCGETAFCQVLPSCNNQNNDGTTMQPFLNAKEKNIPQCTTGIHIKPESTALWTVSILNKNQPVSNEFIWAFESKEFVKCKNHNAVRGDFLPNTVDIEKASPSSSDSLCTFKIRSRSGKLSEVLDGVYTPANAESIIFFQTALYPPIITFKAIDARLRCRDDLFLKPSECDSSEQCDETVDKKNLDCPAHLLTMFREDKSQEFIEVKRIKCEAGVFTVTGLDGGPLEATADSSAKCARKKCSLCQPNPNNFTQLFQAGNATHCASLKCTDKQFMVLNTTKGDHRGIPANEAVQCSTVADPIAKDKPVPAEQARWHVQNDKEAEIEWAVCKESVPCDLRGVKIQTTCAKDEQNCKKAELKADGAYVCNEGTMHVEMNGTSEHIDPPKCEDNGQYNLTIYDAKNVTSSRLWEPTDGNLKIKCLLAAVIAASEAPASASSWYIIAIVIVLVLVVIGVVIGVLFILKRRKNKQKPVSKASKSSSTATKSSSKPESSAGEKEPLTSAMKSITGDSVHTAIPEGIPKQTPPAVVMTGADLRPVTAAAQPSTKRDKKSSTSGRNKDSEKKKRDAKQPLSEDTSKNQDVENLEKLVPMPGSDEDRESLLKSQTGGDGESQVESQKRKKAAAAANGGNPDSAKPQGRRKYRQSSSTPGPKKKDDNFLHLTDSDDNNKDDEPSQTGSKKRGRM